MDTKTTPHLRVTARHCIAVRDIDGILGEKWKIVPEHRLLMAKKIGRPLSKNEFVHRKNPDKTDSRIENPMIPSPEQHAFIHRGSNRKKHEPEFTFAGCLLSTKIAIGNGKHGDCTCRRIDWQEVK